MNKMFGSGYIYFETYGLTTLPTSSLLHAKPCFTGGKETKWLWLMPPFLVRLNSELSLHHFLVAIDSFVLLNKISFKLIFLNVHSTLRDISLEKIHLEKKISTLTMLLKFNNNTSYSKS